MGADDDGLAEERRLEDVVAPAVRERPTHEHDIRSGEEAAQLADEARGVLDRLGYRNLRVIAGDGSRGFPEAAPYDAILVSAAAYELPRALVEQLAEGGRMIIPVGPGDSQQLQLIRKEGGHAHTTLRELCRFVPLVQDGAQS